MGLVTMSQIQQELEIRTFEYQIYLKSEHFDVPIRWMLAWTVLYFNKKLLLL